MLTRRTVLWVKRETDIGTDPAMSASDAVLAYDIDPDFKGEVLQRPVLRDTLSKIPHVIGMKESALTFKTEIKGAGMTGTVPEIPEIATLLSGCAFNTGVYTGTTLVFSLVSAEADINSLAFRVFLDGNMHKMVGTRGTVKFNLNAGNYGEAEWTFSGLFIPVSAITIPDITGLGSTKPPIVYNSSFQIGGFSPICSAAEIDLANNVIRRDSLNSVSGVHSFRITDREPKLSFDSDAVIEATNPFWGDWEGNVVATWAIQIGSDAGNIIKMDGYFEYETNKYADQDGVRKYDEVAALVSSDVNTQDDELVLTFV